MAFDQRLATMVNCGGDKLTDYIRTYDNVVDDDFCSRAIEQFEQDESIQEKIDREQRPTFTEVNISKQYIQKNTAWYETNLVANQAYVQCVSEYMDEMDLGPDFPAKYAFEEFRLKRYIAGTDDQFKDHVDVQDYNSARRFLVCFLYLNDVKDGGNTNFPKLDYSITPKRGRMLLFPSTWMFRHAGLPVIRGTKYILGTYLHYL
tara:strand:+ start:269 stop:880 length:612 start_codon:yes stop_codon:yes gene_type:complete